MLTQYKLPSKTCNKYRFVSPLANTTRTLDLSICQYRAFEYNSWTSSTAQQNMKS